MTPRPAAAGRRTHPTRAAVGHLLGQRGFRSLFFTRILSQAGDGIFQLAAADLLLFKNPGANPAWTLTKLSVVTLIPFSIIVPFVGVFIDRWDRRRILTITPLLRAGLVALMPLVSRGNADKPLFYLLVLLILSGNRFFLATMSAVLPSLVDESELLVANSLATTGGSIANVAGLAIGAGLSSIMGGTKAGVVGGAGFLAAALLARTIPVQGARPEVHVRLGAALRRVVDEMFDGIGHIRQSRAASFALRCISVQQLLIGASLAATTVVYIRRLHLGVGSVTSLLSVLLVGIFAGVVMVPLAALRVREERLLVFSFLLGGLATLITAAVLSQAHLASAHPSSGLARVGIIAGSLFAGISFAFAKIPVDTMVQESLPDEFRGRAFASYDMLYNVARVTGTAVIAGFIALHASEPLMIAGIGGVYLASAFRAARATRKPLRPTAAPATTPSADDPPRLAPAVKIRTFPFEKGELVHFTPRGDGKGSIIAGGKEVTFDRVEWSGKEQAHGVERRIVALRAQGTIVRLAYDDATERWEISSFITPLEDR